MDELREWRSVGKAEIDVGGGGKWNRLARRVKPAWTGEDAKEDDINET